MKVILTLILLTSCIDEDKINEYTDIVLDELQLKSCTYGVFETLTSLEDVGAIKIRDDEKRLESMNNVAKSICTPLIKSVDKKKKDE